MPDGRCPLVLQAVDVKPIELLAGFDEYFSRGLNPNQSPFPLEPDEPRAFALTVNDHCVADTVDEEHSRHSSTISL